ncbi:vacuolar protein sorting-associated protein VTA1 homolog [Colletes gigas]|uniref:vacuolar protein sorting-associated protein VTA1 homolog n=1 Tax=Colletes gigas TaxID=935657 RepID=UPI001C9B0A10|nr:vacuolar protein sorting-associated protein VTA1 homolog [Colletes gigas]XP_043254414.1 vacuolar protein sorting-associated protein VTA1 homolog [Colletes gigas]XP_043254415.1 vacuolar protein sorting-associated protein VTA1 homolog [Colletes gigas]
MVGLNLPEIPQPLKNIEQSLRIASVYDQRDPVVSYWCRLYALQTGLKLSTKTPEETNFLLKLMDWLEMTKKESRDNEAITNDAAAQAHLENWAEKIFLFADTNDRASNITKKVAQSFFTAGLLYDVLTVIGELSESDTQKRKYAKWKATYIYNCLQNGETPIPGPIEENTENIDLEKSLEEELDNSLATMKTKEEEEAPLNTDGSTDSQTNSTSKGNAGKLPSDIKEDDYTSLKTEGGVELSLEQINNAQKFIKWAGGALNYDDVPLTVTNLRKALNILTLAKDSDD